MIKKKILWSSDFSKLCTGFGRNSKAVLKYLYDTGKYDIIEYVSAPYTFSDKRLKSVPWKAYGSIPEDSFTREEIKNDPQLEATVKYGSFYINELIDKEKPDCYIGVNDFWAFKDFYDKPWWNKVNCALWITLDSLPIYNDAIENAHKIKNFWVWSKFAENDMKKHGFDHVKTLHGAFDVSDFRPLPDKKEIKKRFGLEKNFIYGFVFRNQPRKLIGTLLEGFAQLKKSPNDTSKLLLHTCWSEGWDIPKYIEEFKLKNEDILTTHICTNCKKYFVKNFISERTDCPNCNAAKSVITPNGGFGLTEAEMNEIYNLMDFYIHPITSGGLEMPLVESLLAGTPISTVDYSCGEEFCEQPFVTKLPFSTYREFGSQFIKSQPYAKGICDVMERAQSKDFKKNLAEISRKGREWALKEFDLNSICKKIEDWIDNCPEAVHDYNLKGNFQNDKYEFNSDIECDEEWAIDLISNVFGFQESSKSETVKKMVKNLKQGETRVSLHQEALSWAKAHNEAKRKSASSNFFKNELETNNVCLVSPDSLEEKIIFSKFLSDLCEKEENVFVVGEEIDEIIFSQFGKFVMLPRNENSVQVDWLISVKTSEGKKRFKDVYFKNGNELQRIKNE